jgi:hypothetical protein
MYNKSQIIKGNFINIKGSIDVDFEILDPYHKSVHHVSVNTQNHSFSLTAEMDGFYHFTFLNFQSSSSITISFLLDSRLVEGELTFVYCIHFVVVKKNVTLPKNETSDAVADLEMKYFKLTNQISSVVSQQQLIKTKERQRFFDIYLK